MTPEDQGAQMAALAAEETALRDRLRALEDELHTTLRRDPHGNAARIDAAERELRKIVLRLVEIEREQIELRLSASL
jgi:hypothetical protein